MNYKLELRITKYDPQYRNEIGIYLRDEWIGISDIGKTFEGKVLTASDYFGTEDRYIEALKTLLGACGISEMRMSRGHKNWRVQHNNYVFQEIPFHAEKIKPMIDVGDLYEYRVDDQGTEIHIPHQSISEEEMLDWTTWFPIPASFFTNTKTFRLSDDFVDSLGEGRVCTVEEIELLSRLCLREDFDCIFTGPNDSYIHFGWDYYMYFGGDFDCDWTSLKFPEGIFVEAFPSPWFPEEDGE